MPWLYLNENGGIVTDDDGEEIGKVWSVQWTHSGRPGDTCEGKVEIILDRFVPFYADGET